MWVFDEDVGMNCREVTYVPGLYKIFDEILVNAADNKQRDKNMTKIKIDIKQLVTNIFLIIYISKHFLKKIVITKPK